MTKPTRAHSADEPPQPLALPRYAPKQLQPRTLTKISRHTSPNTTMEPAFGEWDRANWHGRRSLRETAFFYSKHPATSRRLMWTGISLLQPRGRYALAPPSHRSLVLRTAMSRPGERRRRPATPRPFRRLPQQHPKTRKKSRVRHDAAQAANEIADMSRIAGAAEVGEANQRSVGSVDLEGSRGWRRR